MHKKRRMMMIRIQQKIKRKLKRKNNPVGQSGVQGRGTASGSAPAANSSTS